MTDDDPFAGDGDRTVFKPTPGGRRRGPAGPPQAPPPQQPPAQPAPAYPSQPQQRVLGNGLNPLVDAAGPLLSLASQLRNTMRHPDPAGLRNHVAQEIKAFEASARGEGVTPETTLAARYCLCTFLDETVLSTPWGSESGWANQTLLSSFHNEGFGGEKFFVIIERLLQEPARNLDLLELLHICLALGFQGKYRLQDMGQSALAGIQDNLYRSIRAQRGDYERALSPRWRGVEDLRNPLARYVPMWVVVAIAAAVLLSLFVGLRLALGTQSDPVYTDIRSLGRDTGPLVVRQPVRPTADLTTFLSPEIQEGLVDVYDQPGRSTVVIKGAGLFGSGSARLERDRYPLLARIAEGLNSVPGRVLVTGHTDSDPIPRSLRLKFASNHELSQKRAEAVVALLTEEGVPPTRVEADGRADTEPLVPNDTREHKARNRRVEIILMTRAARN